MLPSEMRGSGASLTFATRIGCISDVKILIEEGVEIDGTDINGITSLVMHLKKIILISLKF